MQFMATLTHSPDNCWAREEHAEKASDWIEGMETKAEEAGVGLRGAFVAPNEHTFYLVLESDDFSAVTEFLGPPLLQDHNGHVTPVITLQQADEVLLDG